LQQGAAAQAAGNYSAADLQAKGFEAVGAAQRSGVQKLQEGDVAGSKLAANAGFSGGPTIAQLGAQIAGNARYANEGDIFKGKAQQWADTTEGNLAKWQGDTAKSLAPMNAISAGFKGLAPVDWSKAGNSFSTMFG
jgi:hypothetical protein